MAHAVRPMQEVKKEFWRPAKPEVERVIRPLTTEKRCQDCNSELPIDGSFCPVCGTERASENSHSELTFAHLFDMEALSRHFKLPIASILFLVLGIGCIVGAMLTGVIHHAYSILDWEAIQVWRIQWLLGASASILAGILLKR